MKLECLFLETFVEMVLLITLFLVVFFFFNRTLIFNPKLLVSVFYPSCIKALFKLAVWDDARRRR